MTTPDKLSKSEQEQADDKVEAITQAIAEHFRVNPGKSTNDKWRNNAITEITAQHLTDNGRIDEAILERVNDMRVLMSGPKKGSGGRG